MRNPPLCTDARVLAEGTGVSTYAQALGAAQRIIDPNSLALRAAGNGQRWRRWSRALWPWPLRAVRHGPGDVIVDDAFRCSQVAFDLRKRCMPIALPAPPGIMHWSYPMPLWARGWRNVYTIHDLIPLRHPELTAIAHGRHRRLIRAVIGTADLIVTVSEASRNEILEDLGCAAEKVVNCGFAVTPVPVSGPPPANLPSGRYLLVLGSVEPRKNISRILAAHARSEVGMPLVIAGPSGWRAEEEMAEAGPDVIRLPWLSEAERNRLLTHARALLMPSLAEGFGVPVIEAMNASVPVLCSATGALAETAGRAAWLVDPLDIGAIASGIGHITRNEPLRARLIAAGHANARRFTLASFADELAAAYAALTPFAGTTA